MRPQTTRPTTYLVFAAHGPERRPPARRDAAAILERAVPEAGAPILWFGGARREKIRRVLSTEGEDFARRLDLPIITSP